MYFRGGKQAYGPVHMMVIGADGTPGALQLRCSIFQVSRSQDEDQHVSMCVCVCVSTWYGWSPCHVVYFPTFLL